MDLATIKSGIVSTASSVAFSLKKNSPTLLLIGGCVGVVAGAVMVRNAALKEPEVKADHQNRLTEVKTQIENKQVPEGETGKAKARVYFKTVIKYAQLYGPAVIVLGASIGSVVASNGIMRKRYTALAAAYATLDKGYKFYRKNVVEEFGEDVDYRMANGLKEKEIEETVVNEKGKEKVIKKKVLVGDGKGSMYSRYFTKSNKEWKGTDDLNEIFFNSVESFANDRLQAGVKKFITLNEILCELGLEETKAGMVVGWRYDKIRPSGNNYVRISRRKVYVTNEYGDMDEAWLLDFNVDGQIYDLVEDVGKEAA